MTRTKKTQASDLQGIVTRNMETFSRVQKEDDERRTAQRKIADQISFFTGSLYFVYFHFTLVAMWIAINLGKVPGVKPFDPFPFTLLAVVASVEAIFLSTLVLLSQSRIKEMEDKRANLDLQINLLSEHEITKLIELTHEIAKKWEWIAR